LEQVKNVLEYPETLKPTLWRLKESGDISLQEIDEHNPQGSPKKKSKQTSNPTSETDPTPSKEKQRSQHKIVKEVELENLKPSQSTKKELSQKHKLLKKQTPPEHKQESLLEKLESQIKEILPDVTPDQIKNVLEKTTDIDVALNELLHKDEQVQEITKKGHKRKASPTPTPVEDIESIELAGANITSLPLISSPTEAKSNRLEQGITEPELKKQKTDEELVRNESKNESSTSLSLNKSSTTDSPKATEEILLIPDVPKQK